MEAGAAPHAHAYTCNPRVRRADHLEVRGTRDILKIFKIWTTGNTEHRPSSTQAQHNCRIRENFEENSHNHTSLLTSVSFIDAIWQLL